jgi:hypothetical protein
MGPRSTLRSVPLPATGGRRDTFSSVNSKSLKPRSQTKAAPFERTPDSSEKIASGSPGPAAKLPAGWSIHRQPVRRTCRELARACVHFPVVASGSSEKLDGREVARFVWRRWRRDLLPLVAEAHGHPDAAARLDEIVKLDAPCWFMHVFADGMGQQAAPSAPAISLTCQACGRILGA